MPFPINIVRVELADTEWEQCVVQLHIQIVVAKPIYKSAAIRVKAYEGR